VSLKRLRNVIFWCHLAAGATAGVIILIMSVTGVLLAYQKQIERWADTRAYVVTRPSTDAPRLPVEALLARAREGQTASPSSFTLYADADEPATVSFQGGRNLFVNPYTGEVLGEGSPGVRAFFRTVTDWHRWLGAGAENRAAARAVTGASNLLFLFVVMSGFYLWWPRRWTKTAVRAVTWFRRTQGGRARDFNWHNVVGFWSAVPLFVVVLSGVVISYAWASNLVYKLAGEEPPAQQQRGGPGPQQGQQGAGSSVPLEGLDFLLTKAQGQVEGWRSITLQLPSRTDAPVTFAIDRGNGGQPQLRSQLTLARAGGEVVRWEQYANNTLGRRMRTWLRFAHTGEVYGLIGQTVAALASAGGALRRLFAWLARRRALTAARVEPSAGD
jgi:uncharacterized iron-regulated membrane protein